MSASNLPTPTPYVRNPITPVAAPIQRFWYALFIVVLAVCAVVVGGVLVYLPRYFQAEPTVLTDAYDGAGGGGGAARGKRNTQRGYAGGDDADNDDDETAQDYSVSVQDDGTDSQSTMTYRSHGSAASPYLTPPRHGSQYSSNRNPLYPQ